MATLDRATDTGQRRSVGNFVVDNKLQIGLSVVLIICGVCFWAGKTVQKGDSEKGAVEAQLDSLRAENVSANKSLKQDIQSLTTVIEMRTSQIDKEVQELHKHVEKVDEQISQLTQEMIRLKTKKDL